ncbi:MAG: PAS domain-containing protein [Bacteroidota bacterium]
MTIHKLLLRTVLEAVTEGWWEWRLPENQVYQSEGWFKMLEYPNGALAPSLDTWVDLLHPDEKEEVLQAQEDYMKKDQSWQLEFRLRTYNGTYKWVRSTGKVVDRWPDNSVRKVVGIHQDIDEQKQLEEENKSQKEKLMMLQGVFQVSHTSFNIYDFIRKRLVYSSNVNHLKLNTEVILDIIHPDDVQKVLDHRERIMHAKDQEVLETEFRISDKNGETIWVLVRDSVFRRDENQMPTQALGSALNVTHFKQLESQLNDRVRQLNEISYKSAHQIRGPVATILGLVDLLKQETHHNYLDETIIGHLETTVKKLDDVIHEIILFNKK